MSQHLKVSHPYGQRGVALLEVLIVFFVLSIGLLGMAALQLKSIQYSQSSYMRSQATVAANDMLDLIRLNGGAELTDPELQKWKNFVNGTLPTNEDPKAQCGAGICVITIKWEDRMNDIAGNFTQTLVISGKP